MQVFNVSDGSEPVLIGRCDSANLSMVEDPTRIDFADPTKVHHSPQTKLALTNWLPLTPVSPSQAPRILPPASSTEERHLRNILAMLVERNGGAVVVDFADLLIDRQVTVLQRQDPWGIVLTTEAE